MFYPRVPVFESSVLLELQQTGADVLISYGSPSYRDFTLSIARITQ